MIIISLDETYHIKNGKPLYNKRYKKVMSFHNGIAPVEDEEEAFFIDENNNRLFGKSFKKAYGFYENKSAVQDESGWYHIDINGNELYPQRYSWVGNFNENRCVVRDFQNNYFHIDENGKRVYLENYCYTGDFKYGIAVVIDSTNKATHIDYYGNLIHNKYFDELNIFHKGYAIAKDKNGYFHINKKGEELYSARYKKLEDFYNGCALATTFSNNKVVINESDFSKLEITKPIIDKNEILNENFSFFKFQILFAILKLGVLQKIQNNQKIDLPNISKKLILKWLYINDIIDEKYNLTPLGIVIETELKDIILYWQDLPFKVSTEMVKSLTKGREVFSELFEVSYFEFLENNKYYRELSKRMNNFYTVDYTNILKYLKLKKEVICDIGGGDGYLLDKIKKLYPEVKVIIADKFKNKDIKNIDFIKIDFFKDFTIESDVFIMSRILHDWSDEKALQILKNLVKNMNRNTMLFLLETIVPERGKEDKGITLSFHLLNFLGGYERTLKEFELLLEKAGLKIIEVFEEDELISLMKVVKI